MLPCRPSPPPDRFETQSPRPAQAAEVSCINLIAHTEAFTEIVGTGRRSKDFDLVVEISDGELEADDAPEDDEPQLSSWRNTTEDKAKQQPHTQNAWHVARKVKPAGNGCRRRPLTIGKTVFNGAITVAVVSRADDFNQRDAGQLLGKMKGLLLERYSDEDLLDANDWLHIQLAFAPHLSTRKTLVYVHFENFLRERVATWENAHRNFVLCGRGLPDEFEETGLLLSDLVSNYTKNVKHEIVVQRDDPLYLILYLFAQDIYVRNVQPISLYWPDHLPWDEEEVEEEVTPEHFHISYNPPCLPHGTEQQTR